MDRTDLQYKIYCIYIYIILKTKIIKKYILFNKT